MNIAVRTWNDLSDDQKKALMRRSEGDIDRAEQTVRPILQAVRDEGDQAIARYTLQFDGADISSIPLKVQPEEFDTAENLLDDSLKQALQYAIENVRNYHEKQLPPAFAFEEIRPGIEAGERSTAIDSVGLYVPRGRGSFPSMLYMLAIPAVLAGVPHISVATPALPDGSVDPACLYAARLSGVKTVYRCGGAQAIAAFAYGSESVDPVVKVVGPGSAYVTAAKRLLRDFIDPGLPAGPSEAIVLADSSAQSETVALDLAIEAEHGSDSSAILFTDDPNLANSVAEYLDEYIASMPQPRQDFVRDVLNGYGGIIICEDMEQAVELTNTFATEHLQIQSEHAESYLPKIRNAGEILLGSRVPFSLANYAVGPNAVLPTGGRAKTWSAVSVRDFMKQSSVVRIHNNGYEEIAPHVEKLADYEGFYAHAQALKERKNLEIFQSPTDPSGQDAQSGKASS